MLMNDFVLLLIKPIREKNVFCMLKNIKKGVVRNTLRINTLLGIYLTK